MLNQSVSKKNCEKCDFQIVNLVKLSTTRAKRGPPAGLASRIAPKARIRIASLIIYFPSHKKRSVSEYLPLSSIHGHSFRARRLKLCMWPLLIWALVIDPMRPDSAASEAVSLFQLLALFSQPTLHTSITSKTIEAAGVVEAAEAARRGR